MHIKFGGLNSQPYRVLTFNQNRGSSSSICLLLAWEYHGSESSLVDHTFAYSMRLRPASRVPRLLLQNLRGEYDPALKKASSVRKNKEKSANCQLLYVKHNHYASRTPFKNCGGRLPTFRVFCLGMYYSSGEEMNRRWQG
jgi:hypothetical protein